MRFGINPIKPHDLVGRLEDKLKAVVGASPTLLPPERVFWSLATDEEHLETAKVDKFIALFPVKFPPWQSVVTGAGSAYTTADTAFQPNLGFDAEIRADAYCRFSPDSEFHSSRLLRDESLGVLALALAVTKLQFWTAPTDDDATVSYLREPMRVVAGPTFQKRRGGKSLWSLTSVVFEMKFTADLS